MLYQCQYYLCCIVLLYYRITQYCNMVWACNYPSHLHKLSVIQKRAIRIISAAEFRTNAADLFKRQTADTCRYK